jgi:hypothetical protein
MAAIMTVRDRRAGLACCGLHGGAGSGGGRRTARCGRISWPGPPRNSPDSGTRRTRAGETGAPAGDVGAASADAGGRAGRIGAASIAWLAGRIGAALDDIAGPAWRIGATSEDVGGPDGPIAVPIGMAGPASPIDADGTGELPSAVDDVATSARPDVEIGPAVTPKDVRPDEAGGAGP